jgi:hypothetical protein
MVNIKGELENVGPGPSVATTFVIRARGMRPITVEYEAIGPGEKRPLDIQRTIPASLFEPGDIPYFCATGFRDLFGAEGWVIQRSRLGRDSVLLEHQSPVQRISELQVRESGRLTWRTFRDATRHFYDGDDLDFDADDVFEG